MSLPQYEKASQIGIYLSMPKAEISTRNIVLHALQEKKTVFVPFIYKVTPSSADEPKSVMDMVSLHSQEDYESLNVDAWGIPTPSKESVNERKNCLGDGEITYHHQMEHNRCHINLDMIIMPGMAFDRNLSRLGHGKGFYDFFLHRYHQRKATNQVATATMPFLGKIIMSKLFW